jgi:asparagine synthase (glutamine-hydrolysing)
LELAGRIPARFKVRGGETKWLLKRAFEDRLPRDAVWRPKHGFELPIDGWLRGPLAGRFEESVLARQGRVAALVDTEVAGQLFREHRAGRGRHGNVLWSLLVLARWAERYLP